MEIDAMPTATATPELLTPDEAAEYLRVKPQTLAVWRTTKRYDIAYVRVGARVMYRRSDLDAWLESRTVGAAAED
jgi:excisionase family DNA binding protein